MILSVTIPSDFIEERKFIFTHILERIMRFTLDIKVNENSLDSSCYINWKSKSFVFKDSFFRGNNIAQIYEESNLPLDPVFLYLGGKDFVFLYGEGSLEWSDLEIICHADIWASAFFMLSRWEEQLLPKDKFGRCKEEYMWSVKHGFAARPIVDEYVQFLEILFAKSGIPIPERESQYKVLITHDIDYLFRYAEFKNFGLNLLGDILHRKSLFQFASTLKNYIAFKRGKINDPFDTFDFFLDFSDSLGIKNAFYFKSTFLGEYDATYDIRDIRVKKIIRRIQNRGHEVGFHPSKNTFLDPEQFRKEVDRMHQIGLYNMLGGRQHFLLYSLPASLRVWETAKLVYDAGIGFAFRVGFRCGTSHPYFFFDVEQRRTLNLEIRPLIVMEGAVFSHLNCNFDFAEKEIFRMIELCREHSGTFVFLWHNDFAARRVETKEKLLDIYKRILIGAVSRL